MLVLHFKETLSRVSPFCTQYWTKSEGTSSAALAFARPGMLLMLLL
jgi:hypothetical protein